MAGGQRQPTVRFRVPIDVHAHEPDTIYVVPIKSDSEHFPPDGKLRVYRSRTGGNEWEALTKGLPQRTAMSTYCAMRWPSTRSIHAACILAPPAARFTHPLMLATVGPQSCEIFRPYFLSRSRPCNDPGGAPGASPGPCAHRRRGEARVEGQATQRSVLDALEACYPTLRGTIRDQLTQKRRPFVRFFACEQDLSHEPPDAPLPDAVATAAEPFLVVGAMAGG